VVAIDGDGYAQIARTRQVPTDSLAGSQSAAREVVERAVGDARRCRQHLISGTHQAGHVASEMRRTSRSPSTRCNPIHQPVRDQSTTAVSTDQCAHLIEARQKEARLQLITGIVGSSSSTAKRARDTETGLLTCS